MVAIDSAVATIAAAVVSGVLGLLPWYLERGRRQKLVADNRRRVWSDISKVRGLMADLEHDEETGLGGHGALQATGKLSVMLRDLLQEACSAEPEMSLDVVRKWRACGKLASDWQEELAMVLLHAEEVPVAELDTLRSVHGSRAELPPGHKMRAKP